MAMVPYDPPVSRPEELVSSFTALSLNPEPRVMHKQSSLTHSFNNNKDSSSAFVGHSTLNTYPFVTHPRLHSNLPYFFHNFMPAGPLLHVSSTDPPRPLTSLSHQRPPSPALTVHHTHSPLESLSDFGRTEARRQSAPRVIRPSFNNGANHHNHVDVSRIRDGIDVRTTVCQLLCVLSLQTPDVSKIMLRNIPNKVDQSMLKQIVDDSSWGKYDFMYLRIDFANDCK
jgi:hypothetical protein